MKCFASGPRAVTAVFVVLGSWGFLSGCSRPKPAGAPLDQGAPDQLLGTFTMDSFEKTRRIWSLRAPSAEIFEADHRVEVDQPDLHFFEDDKPKSHVRAARGRFDTATSDIWAGGGVILVSTDGARLESDWMNYDSAMERVTSTAPVRITRGNSKVEGVGWEARPDMSELIVRHQRGEIAAEDATLLPHP